MSLVKRMWENLWFRNLIIILGIFSSFFILDVSLRIYSNQYVGFYRWIHYAPNLFTFSWIFLIIGFLYLLPKKIRIITYGILSIISNLIIYAEYLHFSVLKRFFTFSDILLVKEGSDYFLYAMSKTSIKIIFVMLLSISITIITIWIMNRTKEISKNRYYYFLLILATIVLIGSTRILANYKLGRKVDPLTWEASYKPKNIYIDFNNKNKSLEVSGVYELLIRSTYLYLKDCLTIDKEKIREEIDEVIARNISLQEEQKIANQYTGILAGKNIIYILLESIDSWLVTKEIMPTLYYLQETGLNFTNRYAPTFGGGQTINSEFAMNTGLYAVENKKAIYNYDKNTFSYSLANMLKNNGYSAISIHTNSGNFYNRTYFHEALGFDNHYALDDMRKINHKEYNYYNDSSLVKNPETYNLIVREDPFFSFVITYSAHVPYDDTNDRCITNPYHLKVEENKELSCIRNLARETDEMLRILIEKLEQEKRLDDTVLVLVTDHYAYGYGDQNYIKNYKGTTNEYLLQNVPFIIWDSSLQHKEIDTVMDTADILPTLLNMLGITYQPSYYVGTDVFSDNHEEFVYFSNDSFYDGKILYNEATVDNNKINYIEETISKIREKRELNDKMIISDYFKER